MFYNPKTQVKLLRPVFFLKERWWFKHKKKLNLFSLHIKHQEAKTVNTFSPCPKIYDRCSAFWGHKFFLKSLLSDAEENRFPFFLCVYVFVCVEKPFRSCVLYIGGFLEWRFLLGSKLESKLGFRSLLKQERYVIL